MLTAARGATLILLGALLAQSPLTAAAYQPRDPGYRSGPAAGPAPTPSLSTSTPTATLAPTDPPTKPIETVAPSQPVPEPPAARSWSDLVKQVAETSPGDLQLRSADTSAQASSMLRCFKLDDENYCLGLGFVDQMPSGARLQELISPPASLRADGDAGVEQDIPTGDLTPAAFVAQRAAMPKSARVTAELDELEAAWAGRSKARELRLLSTSATPAAP